MKHLTKKDFLSLANKINEKYLILVTLKNTSLSIIYNQKNRKSAKQSEIITYQPKAFQNPNIVDIKSVIREHPQSSHKLSKTRILAERVDSYSSLNSD